MKFACARCGQAVAKPVWIMWGKRLVRVGQDCADRIRQEAAQDKAVGSGAQRPG